MGTQTLAEYARRFGRMARASFEAHLTDPVLVEIGVHTEPTTGEKKKESFYTDYVNPEEVMARYLTPDRREVFIIKKREDSVFSGHISVGRTPNLDVCIARSGISKFHAHFSLGKDGIYRLTDKESKNGTFVDGERVLSSAGVPVDDASEVRFASHSFRFMLPSRFHQLLQSLANHQRP